MKIRTTKYIIKEGMLNAYRNKLMSLASLSIVTASLVIFGVFFLFSINLNHNIAGLKEQPEIEVFCLPELDDTQTKQIEDDIKNNADIQSYTAVTKKENFDKMKKSMLNGKESVLTGLDESFMPVSYIVKLKDPQKSEKIVSYYKALSGVENVKYPQQVIEIITKLTYWVPLICAFLLIILLIVSMFIISNTIKLTVFARRREINIMKYIGATDWFIRWPFIIEGVIIGLIGALFAFLLTSYFYNVLENMLSDNLFKMGIDLFRMVSIKDVAPNIILIYSLIGACVGSIGSFISIRKYLHV
ncbi:MAG: permease-like cell division protein FtsX [Clostridia bacterium]|nr:permease-like cell division protein FtsX [Clostridia bacterium]